MPRGYERILQIKLGRDRSLMEDGYRALVVSALYLADVDSPDEINKIACKEFGLKSLPSYIIKNYLSELMREGTVFSKNGRYSLNDKQRQEITELAETRKGLISFINNRTIDEVEKHHRLDSSLKTQIEDIVSDIITSFFVFSSRVFSGYLLDEKRLVFDLPSLKTIIDDKLRSIADNKLQEDIEKSIETVFLEDTNPIIYQFLYEMFQIYVYFEILNIDPESQIRLKVNSVYLDTNVLLDLVLPTRERNLLAKEHVRLAQGLGMSIKYTERTRLELINVIREYRKATSLPETMLEKFRKWDEGGLIEAYFRERESNPSLTFDGYCIWLEKAFENMLEQLKVELDRSKTPEAEEYEKDLIPIIDEAAQQYLRYKMQEALLHDAFCLSLAKYSQGVGKELCLIVTDDHSLFYVSRALIQEGKIRFPLSVEADVWLQALTFLKPLGKERDSADAFRQFVLGSLSPSLRPISTNKLISVAYPWLKTEYLSPDELEEIISEKFIEDHITKAQEIKGGVVVIRPEEIIKEYVTKAAEQKIKKLQGDLDQAIQEKDQAEKKYRSVTASPIKIPILFKLGIISFAVLVGCAILSALGLKPHDMAFWCFTLLAAVFIGASIFGEKIFGFIFKGAEK